MKTPSKASSGLWFPGWARVLQADTAMLAAQRESYRRTIVAFLRFCGTRRAAATVALAREFVEMARQEEKPAAPIQEWKEALNWFFRKGREAAAPVLKGVPPLAREDRGSAPWEQALIAGIRERHFSWRTEQTYRGWLGRFVKFLGPRKVSDAGAAEVKTFLSRLAVEERASVATQKQALNALVFFFREVEGRDLGDFGSFVRARKRIQVPVVLNRNECERLFEAMEGTARLMAELMFGSGLRLTELLRLRVHPVR